jgi:hypothetical protein
MAIRTRVEIELEVTAMTMTQLIRVIGEGIGHGRHFRQAGCRELAQLVAAGKVYDTGERRRGHSGRPEIVWAVRPLH